MRVGRFLKGKEVALWRLKVPTVRSKWLPLSHFLNFIYRKISVREERDADYKFIVIIIVKNISVLVFFMLKYAATLQ
jgi:hypothetical protein